MFKTTDDYFNEIDKKGLPLFLLNIISLIVTIIMIAIFLIWLSVITYGAALLIFPIFTIFNLLKRN